MVSLAKRILLGRPIASSEEGHQRLRKRIALPIFASDAISSTAYATDEIVLVLVAQAGIGVAAFSKLVPIAIIVSVLLVIVVLSYRQTIYAYPSGGGAYVVSRENLGEIPSLVAGASLMTDYILTVAVSVAGGVLAIQSAFGFDAQWRVPLCLLLIGVMTVANLRGLKESGSLFAPPTYLYIVMLMLLIVVGCYRIFVKDLPPIPLDSLSEEARELAEGGKALGIMMLLRAFSSGAVALSGVEAVSNGVPSFRKPAARNAATTLAIMAGILGVCFIGVSVLASHLHPLRGEEDATGIALMAEYIYNGKGVLFWITQLATFAILILAANTAYQGFPGLSSIIARDGYLPRQLANRGDKLVFSNGIIFLAVTAGILIVVFKGNISALIPLYAFGVFTGFTLSQAGMIIHHRRLREGRWRVSLAINAVGCLATGIVALVVVVSKFTEGAWIPAVLIPALVDRVPGDLQALPPRQRGGHDQRAVHEQARDAPRDRARRIGAPRRHRGRPLRQVAGPRAPDRRVRGHEHGGAGPPDGPVGGLRDADPPAHDLLAVPGADPPGAGVPRRARRREPRRHHHRRHPRVRDAVEDAVAAQPVGVRPQGPAAVPAEHRRDVGAGPRRRRGVSPGPHRGVGAGSRMRPQWAVMQFWKPHALAKPHTGQLDLRTGDKVRAIIDLPDVAEGATGKVILANGFNWQRYRVLFTDGTELGDLDQRHIEPIGRAAKRLAKAAAKA